MLTCANCQFVNPVDHKFCQRCGEPLPAAAIASSETPVLQVRLMPPGHIKLVPNTYIDQPTPDQPTSTDTAPSEKGRYQVLTVLSQGQAKVADRQPLAQSSLQTALPQLTQESLTDLKATPALPEAAYPYLLLPEAAPPLYDAWEQGDTTVLVVTERPAVSSILTAFSTAVDPLQHVYWMYTLTDLWAALAPVPQWRSSLLLTDNLDVDTDQSLRILKFIPPAGPADSLPQLSDLKIFLQSLLAQPHKGAVTELHQSRQLILTVSSATTLEQLSTELADIGKALLTTPAAVTPLASTTPEMPSAADAHSISPALPVLKTMPPKPSLSSEMPEPQNLDAPSPESPDLEFQSPKIPTPKSDDPSNLPVDDLALESALSDVAELPDPPEGDDATRVLPMKLVSLADAGQTNVGRQRDHNEDCFLIARESQHRADNSGRHTQVHGLYILCDGMGGHDGGEVASQLAAQTLSRYFETHWPVSDPGQEAAPLPNEATVIEGVRLANQAIFDVNEQEQRAGHERMGTTLVMVLLQGTSAVVAHVGDSRLYRHARRLGLSQITTDHEVGQREIARGVDPELAYARPDAYQLTQALGPRGSEDLAPSVSYMSFSEDTLLLLCSDGLSDNDLVEDYLETHIDPLLRSRKALAVGVDDLIKLSNEVNGHDNITAIAVRLEVSPDLEKGNLGYASSTLIT